jgi:hypothetical protein
MKARRQGKGLIQKGLIREKLLSILPRCGRGLKGAKQLKIGENAVILRPFGFPLVIIVTDQFG